ncbi:MAG: hypothetical protein LC659_08430 [Myxococcales bacterium]|nr:hypothetical protein [Myxococcales bacterium]
MIARWLRRGAAALAGLALDAAVDSLELGKRCATWVSHTFGARGLAVAALLVLVASLLARGHDGRIEDPTRAVRALHDSGAASTAATSSTSIATADRDAATYGRVISRSAPAR